jgi:hypothetical protein
MTTKSFEAALVVEVPAIELNSRAKRRVMINGLRWIITNSLHDEYSADS